MKDEIIQHLFSMLLPSQQSVAVSEIREQFVMTDAELCEIFGITEDDLQIILSR